MAKPPGETLEQIKESIVESTIKTDLSLKAELQQQTINSQTIPDSEI